MDSAEQRVADRARMLARTRLFGNLDDATRFELAERAVERTYGKGEFICHEGDLGDSLFVVVEGLVKVFVTSSLGDEMVLVTLPPPEVFGELSLVDGGPRSASAEAVEPTKLLVLSRPTFLDMLRTHPGLADALLRSLGELARRLTEQASDLVFLDLYGRVAKLLVGLADERGEPGEDGIVLDLKLTQTDLAGMVGGSRQSVNQILRAFDRRGYVELRGRTVVVKQPDLLRRRAGL
ncbi:MAG TPA: Crp/Fnr family transcriptional regulator [Actinomycetota bacterium]|jgi:CRP/FNR family transcriptional regulator, cyclic AMP receptor protein|nr:Crp/Fnr family transcriptional regulator [Actinomycetota bacterium]